MKGAQTQAQVGGMKCPFYPNHGNVGRGGGSSQNVSSPSRPKAPHEFREVVGNRAHHPCGDVALFLTLNKGTLVTIFLIIPNRTRVIRGIANPFHIVTTRWYTMIQIMSLNLMS